VTVLETFLDRSNLSGDPEHSDDGLTEGRRREQDEKRESNDANT
jgi:hypothetical protein